MRASFLIILALTLAGCRKKDAVPDAGSSEESQNARQAEHGDDGHKEDGNKNDHGEGHSETLRLTPEAARSAQLETATAEARELTSGLSLPSRLTFPQQGVAKVSARVPGRLVSIEVQLGETVQQDAVLGFIESPELGQARADYLSAATKTRVARSNFDREKALLEKGITSEKEMLEAESAFVTVQADRNAAEARLHTFGLSEDEIAALKREVHYSSRFPLRSPISGTVVEVLASPGQSLDSATPLFTVGDLSTLWALLDAPESQVYQLRKGQRVELSVTGLPSRRFVGRVEYIGDIVEEKSRTIPVRVVVPNEDGALKPGMFANAQVVTTPTGDGGSPAASRVVVPREAVQTVGNEKVVFVPSGPNQFSPVPVEVGNTTATEAEIVSGLKAGTQVVTRGAFILKSELSKESMGEGHSH